VTRSKARPLRPTSLPRHHAGERRAKDVRCRWSVGSGAHPPRRPFGCGWRSVARRRPISRVCCHSRRHRPVRVRIPNGSFLRRCIGLRRHSASPTCENRAPTKRRGLGGVKHERDAFRRVVRRALTRSTNPEDVALTPQLPNCTPVRDAPSPQLSPPRGEPKTDILWIPVRARVARRVRALVTRSAGGPPDVFRRLVRSTKQRCVRPTSAHSLESIGHPDRRGYQPFYGPVRTAFHDAVARLPWSRLSLGAGVFFPPSRGTRATSDTPVAFAAIRTARLRSRLNRFVGLDRLASWRVNATELPRPGVPSPFPSRTLSSRAFSRDRSVDRSTSLCRKTMPIARHRGGDATQHLIRSHSRTCSVLARAPVWMQRLPLPAFVRSRVAR
jgi:hypothetical protein